MTVASWTPSDEEARKLLRQRIDYYDADVSVTEWWDTFLWWLSDVLSMNIDGSGGGQIFVIGLLMIAAGVLAYFLVRFLRAPVAHHSEASSDGLVDHTVSAQQYVAQARQSLADGSFKLAYVQAYRALVRNALHRDLVAVTPATTATVFGQLLGSVFASHQSQVVAVSDRFNAVIFGNATPTRGHVEELLLLVNWLDTAQPEHNAVESAQHWAVPR